MMYNPPLVIWILLGINLFFAGSMIWVIYNRFRPDPILFHESKRFRDLMKWYGVSENEAFEEFAKIPNLEALRERNDEMEKAIHKKVKDCKIDLKKK